MLADEVDRLIEHGRTLHGRVTHHLDQADGASVALGRLLDGEVDDG